MPEQEMGSLVSIAILAFLVYLAALTSAFVPSNARSVHRVWPATFRQITFQSASQAEATHAQSEDMEIDPGMNSLASSYLVRIDSPNQKGEERWSLISIDEAVKEGGDLAAALQASPTTTQDPCSILTCRRSEDVILADVFSNKSVQTDLVAVLLRIMVQRTASRHREPQNLKTWRISLPGEDELSVGNLVTEEGVLGLFSPIFDSSSSTVELVEMTTQAGEPLGMVPRPLVHTFNLLHRGIGMVVAKETPILFSGMTTFPDLYVHHRTDTKRIFPSLYDMFVGGVSSAKEDARTTAKREVSEELGLSRALQEDGALSDPLFDCIVCTSYNRCVVTVFCYTFDESKGDNVAWQEEEVAWGDFVPYAVIQEAARLSIQRMVSSGTWPGSIQPYALQAEKDSVEQRREYGDQDWRQWDFVPDGLLVWEAWLRWQDGKLSVPVRQ